LHDIFAMPDQIDENTQEETMPLGQRNGPLPPDDDDNEDVMASRYLPPRYREGSPLPPDPPGREDIMASAPWDIRLPRKRSDRHRVH
jgi:hypothetical protein